MSAWPQKPNGTGQATAPAISIVIPAYNCERYLTTTIRSIQAQTRADWECVIVDDGSTDGTLKLARALAAEDSRIQVTSEPNSGPSLARNHGTTLISPDSTYITFMDSDDIWVPDALETLSDEIERHPEAIGAHGIGRCIDANGDPYDDPAYTNHGKGRFICDPFGRPVALEDSMPTSFQSLWFSNPFPPGLILAKRTAYEKVGFFDPVICPMEDWDMVLRLSRQGGLRFVDRVLLSYRRHPANLSSRSASDNSLKLRGLFYKTFHSRDNDETQERIVRLNWRATQARNLRHHLRVVREHIASARFKSIMTDIKSIGASCLRFARGYPTQHGI